MIQEFRRISLHSGRHLRIQVIHTPHGWTHTVAEIVGEGPVDLRGYEGGWRLTPQAYYDTLDAAITALIKHDWEPV